MPTRHMLPMILPIVLIALLETSPSAIAQNQPQTESQNQPQTGTESPQTAPEAPVEVFSEDKIEAFADAAIGVQQAKSDFDTQAQGVDDQEELAKLHQDAQTQALQAVESSGLSPEEYQAIIQAANQDPELYTRIVEVMEQRSAQ